MKRLTISVDDVATLRYVLKDRDFDPVQFAMLCEVAGAHGIVATLTEAKRGIQERDVQLLKRLNKSFLNLHIPPNSHLIKVALTINPDMVTFIEAIQSEEVYISPMSSTTIFETLPDILPDFHANNISVAVFCYPDISLLKQLTRVEIDYVEFDCSEITMAVDSNEELVAIDKLNSAAVAAAKLGLGVNCFGGINYNYLPALSAVPRLEDICMGLSIVKRAMLVGINQAVEEALQQLILNQRN